MALNLLQQAQISQPGLNSVYRGEGSDFQFGLGDLLINMLGYLGFPGVSQSIANLASGGSIGLAPNTVDQAGMFLINQTTASQTINLPNPSNASIQRRATLVNVGSQAFSTASGTSVAAGKAIDQIWNGSSWADIL